MLEGSPKDIFLRYALALEYLGLQRDKEALGLFEEIFKDDPSYLPNYYHLGKTLEGEGLIDRAKLIYSIGMKLAQGKQELRTLNELRSALESL